MNFILVGLLAGVGALVRRNFTVFFRRKISARNAFIATLLLNLIGFGLILFFYLSLDLKSIHYLVLTTGFLGGLTTFSTFNSELINLWFAGRRKTAVYYLLGTYTIAFIILLLCVS